MCGDVGLFARSKVMYKFLYVDIDIIRVIKPELRSFAAIGRIFCSEISGLPEIILFEGSSGFSITIVSLIHG